MPRLILPVLMLAFCGGTQDLDVSVCAASCEGADKVSFGECPLCGSNGPYCICMCHAKNGSPVTFYFTPTAESARKWAIIYATSCVTRGMLTYAAYTPDSGKD
jgi:hypothetical protein